MNQRALLLINPQARRGRDESNRARRELAACNLEILEPDCPDVRDFAACIRQHAENVDLVVVGGGDGTLNSVAGILHETGLPLGILPLGTANDLARTLGLPRALPAACRAIASGRPHRIDLGWVNGQYFFNVASLGLSARIAQQLSPAQKRRWSRLAYVFTAIRVLLQAQPLRAEIELDDQTIAVKTMQLSIGNGRYYGGGLAIARDAAIDDQRLDLYSLETRHWWELIRLLPALWQGYHFGDRAARQLHAREIRIRTAGTQPINTDGELTTQTPAHFRVIPQAIAVLTP